MQPTRTERLHRRRAEALDGIHAAMAGDVTHPDTIATLCRLTSVAISSTYDLAHAAKDRQEQVVWSRHVADWRRSARLSAAKDQRGDLAYLRDIERKLNATDHAASRLRRLAR